MAKTQPIGQIDCHVCGFDADVKLSEKNGLAYTFCGDCNVQSFCRNQNQHDKLIKKMRPVTVTVTENKPPVTLTQDKPPVTEKKAGFSLGAL